MSHSDAVARAAAELSRVVLAESQASALAFSKEAAGELKAINGLTAKLVDTTHSAGAAASTQLAAVAAELKALKVELLQAAAVTRSEARHAARLARIQWAISNAHVGEFKYSTEPIERYERDLTESRFVVVDALKAFMIGNGAYATGFVNYKHPPHTYDHYGQTQAQAQAAQAQKDAAVAQAAQSFRNKLVAQLFSLLGEKPELTIEKATGKYVVALPSA